MILHLRYLKLLGSWSFVTRTHALTHTHTYIYIFLKSNPSRQHSKVLYRWGVGQEKRRERKSRKIRSEEKVVGFSSASVFLARKLQAVTQGGII